MTDTAIETGRRDSHSFSNVGTESGRDVFPNEKEKEKRMRWYWIMCAAVRVGCVYASGAPTAVKQWRQERMPDVIPLFDYDKEHVYAVRM